MLNTSPTGVATPVAFYKKEVDGTLARIWVRIPANTGVVTEVNLYDENGEAVYRLLQTLDTPPARPTYARIEIDMKEMSL